MKRRNQYGIIGSEGKMGLEIQKILSQEGAPFFGVDKVGKFKMKSAPFNQAKILIDFSNPTIFKEILKISIENEIPLVSGTTGLREEDFQKMKKASEKIPILWSANMSLGIAVLKNAMKSLSSLREFDFQIEEHHHKEKKDAPSGTAKILQEHLQKITQKKSPNILSMRSGGLVGNHMIHAVSQDEHLIFEHRALHRRVFASGAIFCAKWLLRQKEGFYSIEDLIHEF